jgi:hypothetical protein
MERMVNDRVAFVLEKEKLLAPAQCGFRSHRSAVDNLISSNPKLFRPAPATCHRLL